MTEAEYRELRVGCEWLDSPVLSRIASGVAQRFRLGSADRDDLEQELRIAAWRMGSPATLSVGWFYRVAAHIALRLRAAHRRSNSRDPMDTLGSRPISDIELLCLLRARASLLPLEVRTAYELTVQGMSEREIALRLGVSRGKVRRLNEWYLRRFVGKRAHARGDQRRTD